MRVYNAYIVGLSLIATVLSSCIDKFAAVPADVIPEDKMRDICINLHTLEGTLQAIGYPGDSATLLYRNTKIKIIKKAGYDTATYNRSMKFYTTHTANYRRIYEQVVDSLALREQKGIWKIAE